MEEVTANNSGNNRGDPINSLSNALEENRRRIRTDIHTDKVKQGKTCGQLTD